GRQAAVFVADKPGGVDEIAELHALFFGEPHFDGPGRALGFRAAVDDGHFLGPQADGGAGRVHGGVARADDGHPAAHGRGRAVARHGPRSLHEEVFGGPDAFQVAAGDVHDRRPVGAHADEDRFVALFEQFVHRHVPPDDDAVAELYAQPFNAFRLRVDDALRQDELGNAVGHDAARQRAAVEHGHRVAFAAEEMGHGQARGTGADDGHFLPGPGGRFGQGVQPAGQGAARQPRFFGQVLLHFVRVLQSPVADEPLQGADVDGIAPVAHDAVALALVLPRADAAGARQQGVLRAVQRRGLQELAFGDEVDEIPDGIVVGTADFAGGAGALQTALGFQDGLLGGVAQVHLGEVVDAIVNGQVGDVKSVPADVARHRDPPRLRNHR